LCIATHIGSFLPQLVTTSWSPSHSGLCQFKITLFAHQQWAHQPYSSFRFPSHCPIPPVHVLTLVCDPCPIISLHLFWSYNQHTRENIQFLSFWAWQTSLKMMLSSSIHLLANKISFFEAHTLNHTVWLEKYWWPRYSLESAGVAQTWAF
jgi:hypothetical protein